MINVLCLHGCNQTQSAFEGYMKNFIKLGKQYNLNMNFIEAKYDHPIGGKTWYHKPLVVEDIGRIEYDQSLVQNTLDDIYNIIEEKDISVLFGFSQGGNVIDTFLTYRGHSNLKCAVILSGYNLVNSERDKFTDKIDIPVLLVGSDDDTVVPYEFTPTYKNSFELKHNKGHKLPTKNTEIRKICKFMETQTFD